MVMVQPLLPQEKMEWVGIAIVMHDLDCSEFEIYFRRSWSNVNISVTGDRNGIRTNNTLEVTRSENGYGTTAFATRKNGRG